MSSKKEENRILIRINSFGAFIKTEDIPEILNKEIARPDLEFVRSILAGFFDLPIDALSQNILERYVEVTTEKTHTQVAPSEDRLFERLTKPLSSAKKNYCLGEYAAAIALSGTVAEMLILLLWEINEIRIKGELISSQQEKALFGKKFDDLVHFRRVQILKTFGIITEGQYKLFDQIRKKRNDYLHSWSVDVSNEKEDAAECVRSIFQLFLEITQIGISDAGTVKINPKLLNFFKEVEEA